MRQHHWIRLLAVWAIVSVLVFATGCNGGNTTKTSPGQDSSITTDGTTSGNAGTASGTSSGNTTVTTSNAGAAGGRMQYVGDSEGIIAAALEEEFSFSKVRPLQDGYVYTLEEGYEGLATYQDDTGFEYKMEEFHFYPQINDSSEQVKKFNKAMRQRILWDYDQFQYRAGLKSTDRRGTTYRAYRHQDLVSIVLIDWACAANDTYARAFTFVYDTKNSKFLSKQEIWEKAGLKEREFSETFDAWYAHQNQLSDVMDTKRIYAPGLLQMWAYDYHLPLGEWVDTVTSIDGDLYENAGATGGHIQPEFGLFFDDACMLNVGRTLYVVNSDNGELPIYTFLPDGETLSWIRELRFEQAELEVFQTLADKAGGDQSQTKAFVVFLGNKRDPEQIKRRLAALGKIPGIEMNFKRIISNLENFEGEIEMYFVIPRHENAVMGIDPSPLYWEVNAEFGPAVVIKDSRESFLNYVFRDYYSNVMLKNDVVKAVLDTGRDEGGFVDISELIGESNDIPENVNQFVDGFYNNF